MPITLASLSSFDWFLIVLIAASTFAAFLRGIIKVLFSLLGLVFGIVLAGWNYLALANRLDRWILSLQVAEILAFLLILVAVMMLFTLAAGLLRKAVRTVGLGILDRLAGAAFGFVRGLLLGVALLSAVAAFLPQSPWVRDSRLAPYFLSASAVVTAVVPARLARKITDGARQLVQQTPELFKAHRTLRSM